MKSIVIIFVSVPYISSGKQNNNFSMQYSEEQFKLVGNKSYSPGVNFGDILIKGKEI